MALLSHETSGLLCSLGMFLQPQGNPSQLRAAFTAPVAGSPNTRLPTPCPRFREIQDEELQQFCSRVIKRLQKDEPGPDAVDALQRLFLIVSATKYKRKCVR